MRDAILKKKRILFINRNQEMTNTIIGSCIVVMIIMIKMTTNKLCLCIKQSKIIFSLTNSLVYYQAKLSWKVIITVEAICA
jgi:hypothetical protein